jgi:mannosyltransferase
MNNPSMQLILGNSNKRFSGVTSTMLQVLPHQKKLMETAVLGKHHLPEDAQSLTFRQFTKLCKKALPDGNPRIFHARRNDEMIQALIAKKIFRAKIKIVFTSTAQRHHSRFTRWLMSQMDAIITTCNAANSYLKTPADIIIPHGIDIENYTPSNRIKSAEINIGVFGRIRPSKGIDLLIDAAIPILKNHPQATLNVCGETTPKFQSYLDEQKVKISAANLTNQVKFLGKVEFNSLPDLYRSMDIVCAVSRNEGYGLTPLEAMASGVAVLTSEAGAWKDIIENGIQGYCVPTGDVNAIQEKLELMLDDPKKLTEMGKAGRTHVEKHYTNKKEAEQLCEFFKELSSLN